MGRPYEAELTKLHETYAWAHEVDVKALTQIVAHLAPWPLVTVGSGGSLTAAHFVADLHQLHSGLISKPLTPLDVLAGPLPVSRTYAVMLLSARGTNPDIVGAFRRLVQAEPSAVAVLGPEASSPLGRAVVDYSDVDLCPATPPSGKDGFLATNSLLAQATLVTRAYANCFATGVEVPQSLDAVLGEGLHSGESLASLERSA